MLTEQKSLICTNTLLAVAILTIGIVESVALIKGHNGDFFNVALGSIVALAGGVPTAQGFLKNRRSGITAEDSQPKL